VYFASCGGGKGSIEVKYDEMLSAKGASTPGSSLSVNTTRGVQR
jgi:hypothetical protein